MLRSENGKEAIAGEMGCSKGAFAGSLATPLIDGERPGINP